MFENTGIMVAWSIFAVYFAFFESVTTEENERAFVHFQEDGKASAETFLKYTGEVPDMTEITVCFRLFLEQLRPSTITVVSYATPDYDNEFRLSLKNDVLQLECCNRTKNNFRIDGLNFGLIRWMPLCLAIDFTNLNLQLVFYDQVFTKKLPFLPSKPGRQLKIIGRGILVLGQDQDFYGAGFSRKQSLRGILTDFQIGGSVASEIEMRRFTNCDINHLSIDPVISFQNNFDLFEANQVNKYKATVPSGILCSESDRRLVLLTSLRTFVRANELCKAVGAESHIPRNSLETGELFRLADSYYGKQCVVDNTDIVWTGAKAGKEVGVYYEYTTNAILNYSKPATLQAPIENHDCISIYNYHQDAKHWHGTWATQNCLMEKCAICRYDEFRMLKMRGLCKKSLFDREYFVAIKNQEVIFRGIEYSAIHKRPGNPNITDDYGYWELIRPDKPTAKARFSLKDPSVYPTGRHEWSVEGDHCGVQKMTLSLTRCAVGEFTCDNGLCIPLQFRCDLEIQCTDGSDEDDCQPLLLPKKYSKKISPPRESADQPLNISLFLDIYSIRSFELNNFKFVMDAVITMSWNDERVRFRNLKERENVNNVEESIRSPWIPEFEILGTGNMTSDFQERQYSLTAQKNDNPIPDEDVHFREDELFTGDRNTFKMRRKITIDTACQFDLGYFPFDVQRCKIIILLSKTPKDYVRLAADKKGVLFSGKTKLLEYSVGGVSMEDYVEGLFSGKRVEIVFENLVTFYITSTFIPTLIMLAIGCVTFFFPLEDFQDRVMVTLTSLLVEAAFFTQVSESIPKTAYLKYVDMWFVFCIFCLFIIITALTIINYLYCFTNGTFITRVVPLSSSNKKSEVSAIHDTEYYKKIAIQINKIMSTACPASILAFVILYVVIALAAINNNE